MNSQPDSIAIAASHASGTRLPRTFTARHNRVKTTRNYHDLMTKHHDKRQSGRMAEPVQVYLDRADRDRLDPPGRAIRGNEVGRVRRALAALESQVRPPSSAPAGVAPPLPTFGGKGLQAGVDLDDSANSGGKRNS